MSCSVALLFVQVETEGDVATAFTLARILSNIPPSRGGPTSIVIFDIHALQVGSSSTSLLQAYSFSVQHIFRHTAGMLIKGFYLGLCLIAVSDPRRAAVDILRA